MNTVEEAIGYEFADADLRELALTHRSYASENPGSRDNERLEFLGDAVLSIVVTDFLYNEFPEMKEGELAKVRAATVSRPVLAEIAASLSVGDMLILGKGEDTTGGRTKSSILADALEAVIGAVYLDGGMAAATDFIQRHWVARLRQRAAAPGRMDYKTRLQEVLAAVGRIPEYEVIGKGPDHDKTFAAVLKAEGSVIGTGEGRSKKEAEQAAASSALAELASKP